jgi:hypothetical protein
MLKKINEGRVESDAGFSIHITGLECLKYEDGGHSIEFEWNYDPATRKTYIYVSDVKELKDSEKIIIKNNIKEAVKLLDGTFEIV